MPFRVDGDAVHRVEPPGGVPALAEVGQLGERLAIVDPQLLVAAVGDVETEVSQTGGSIAEGGKVKRRNQYDGKSVDV